jgi:glycosyltransferase involved in cell wall biosynthesis
VRIALVSDCYLPRLGGIEVQVSDLSTHLRGLGHEVAVLTATRGEELDGVARMLPPVRLPVPVNPWAGPGLDRLIARADVVHVHLGVVAPFAVMAANRALRAGLPTVITWHSMLGGLAPVARHTGPWRRWVRAGAVPTSVGRLSAAQVQRVLGPGMPPVQVLHNGIEVSDWAAPGPPPAEGPVRMINAIRFARRKRPHVVLDLAYRIRRELAGELEVEMVVAGAGPLLGPMRQLVAQRGWEGWLQLPGRLSRPELAQRLHRSHLYLSPARMESFGIAALEARTAGMPVAGLADSGLLEFATDGVSGILARDDADLVERTVQLLRDRAALDRMAAHNRTVPPDQAWPAVLEATVSAYEQARQGRAAAARH